MDRRGQRPRRGAYRAHRRERCDAGPRRVHRHRTAPDLPRGLRGRRAHRVRVRAPRPRHARLPRRSRSSARRGEPRRDRRQPHRRPALDGGLHRHPLSVRKARHRAAAGVPVRRHGTSGRHLLQRLGRPAHRVGDAPAVAGTCARHRTRDGAYVVRQPGHHALVRRCVDEGGVRERDGSEDRLSAVPGARSRPAVPAGALPCRLRRRPHRRQASHPSIARQPGRRRLALRRAHLPEVTDRDAAARTDDGAGRDARRAARLPHDVPVRERGMARPAGHLRRAYRHRPARLEPRLARGSGTAAHSGGALGRRRLERHAHDSWRALVARALAAAARARPGTRRHRAAHRAHPRWSRHIAADARAGRGRLHPAKWPWPRLRQHRARCAEPRVAAGASAGGAGRADARQRLADAVGRDAGRRGAAACAARARAPRTVSRVERAQPATSARLHRAAGLDLPH